MRVILISFLVFALMHMNIASRATSKAPESTPELQTVSVLIMFKDSTSRKTILSMEKPKYALSNAQVLGDKLASIDLPSNIPFKSFKTWLEAQPGVVLVEENSQVRMMSTPLQRKKN